MWTHPHPQCVTSFMDNPLCCMPHVRIRHWCKLLGVCQPNTSWCRNCLSRALITSISPFRCILSVFIRRTTSWKSCLSLVNNICDIIYVHILYSQILKAHTDHKQAAFFKMNSILCNKPLTLNVRNVMLILLYCKTVNFGLWVNKV